MSARANKNFSNHSGGVVQVRHTTRYGAVPESLLEDSRLDLDSRAVAAWLAVKQDGWQILVGVLRARLVHGEKVLLGKDRWQRIANELEAAGYLTRTRVNGRDGRWGWHITFTPVPEDNTRAGLAGSGPASDGLPSGGAAGNGEPGHKVVPRKVVQQRVLPTTTKKATSPLQDAAEDRGRCSSSSGNEGVQNLHFPAVTAEETLDLKRLIVRCPIDSRQDLLDEIEGIRRAGGIKRGIVALANSLVNRAQIGKFSMSAGHLVRSQREKRDCHAVARLASMVRPEALRTMSEAEISKLPPNIAKRVREHAVTVTE